MTIKKHVFIILFYGILWGLFEFVLGGYLHYIDHPYNNTIMRTIGYIILGICVFKNKSSLSLLGVGIIAASFKNFNIFTCGIPLNSPGIIDPIISILQQTALVAVVSLVIIRINNLVYLTKYVKIYLGKKI